MNRRSLTRLRTVMSLLAVALVCAWLPGGSAWGLNQPPLNRVTVPEPTNLSEYVKDKDAAIRLGKALFWDMQAGSDGLTACASCHYGAGADPISAFKVTRVRNQLHPGPDTIFGNTLMTAIPTFTTDPLTDVDTPLTLAVAGYPQLQPNYVLSASDFPLFRPLPADARLAIDPLTGLTGDAVTSLSDTNDVVGSQGIRLADFLAVNDTAVDNGTPLADPIFHTTTGPNTNPANNVRQVTGRNAPSVINAVFNFTNFWDGRANNIFNGETPLGPLDRNAGIWIANETNTALEKTQIAIANASLASQAVGPPLNDVEMSFKGRTFPELGRKMLDLPRPLDLQLVHPSDSVLGTLSRATLQNGIPTGNTGINASYRDMIEAAFQDQLWKSNFNVNLPTKANPNEPFSQMEANFSLFWGLAIQLYEATLVSDRTPFDRFQSGNQNALSAAAQRGFAEFDSKCMVCHSGAEFTSAVVGSNIPQCVGPDCNSPVFIDNVNHTLIKQEANPDTFALSVTDTGFFNLGLRPTADNIGRGAGGPDFPFPLSFTRLARLLPPPPFDTPLMPSLVSQVTPDIVNGSFKTPGLRNVELTAPYMHNGSMFTLDEVVEFYTRGGNFSGNPELAAAMQPIGNLRNNPARRFDLVEFMKSLTDERVRNEWAPFDHPELRIPNGIDGSGADIMLTLAATGGAPDPIAPAVLTLNPVTSPTNLTSQLLGGTVDTTATVSVSVNGGTPIFATVACIVDPLTLECAPNTGPTTPWSINIPGMPIGLNSITVTATSTTGGTTTLGPVEIRVTPTATISGTPLGGRTTLTNATLTIGGNGVASYQFSLDGGPFSADTPIATPISLTGLADGTHTVAVLGTDASGTNQQPIASPTTATWTVKANPPVLTLNAVTSPIRAQSLTIGGTVELGTIPSVKIDTAATAGPVRTIGGTGISTWSCDITGLVPGANNITVTALDFVFNTTIQTATVTVILADGNFKGTGIADISDALKALRIAVKLVEATDNDMLHGDVAPLVNGVPAPDNKIDISDALVILRKVVGLISF
jgi:cytochrome c peroxidase